MCIRILMVLFFVILPAQILASEGAETDISYPASDQCINLRGGLNKSLERFRKGSGRVIFMGGSITRMGGDKRIGWANLVQDDLQARFPECKFHFENVGIPSIGSVGHSHRFERDVLAKGKPHLLVIEAAVNDLHIGRDADCARRAMEGVVRSARLQGIEVMMLHFADSVHQSHYAKGEQHFVITQHEAVAEHYAVPSLNLARHVHESQTAGRMDWQRDFKANCHVPALGQRLYAQQIGLFLDKLWDKQTQAKGQAKPNVPLDPICYFNGRFWPLATIATTGETKITQDWAPTDGVKTRAGFVHVPMLESVGAGSGFSFQFEGTGAGLWLVSGPDAGRMRWRVDAGDWQQTDTFTKHSARLYLPRTMMLCEGLASGRHCVEVEVLSRDKAQKGGEVIRVAHLLAHGASAPVRKKLTYVTTENADGEALDLTLDLFLPAGHQATDKRPAIVFFFGGGWVAGSPVQFHPFCEHFARLGFVCASADYRVKKKHGTSPDACVEDGRAAVAYLRAHAKELGIDPCRIAAGGGSAGGHVAAGTGILPGGNADNTPQALLLYNPVIDTSENGYGQEKLGDRWRELSPLHNVQENQPPTLLCHGTADTTTPHSGAVAFRDAMLRAGNVCTLRSKQGRNHGFFNSPKFRGSLSGVDYYDCLYETEDFLAQMGWFTLSHEAAQ